MPTKNPRIHVVLERPLFKSLKELAEHAGLSISLEARELIREAIRPSSHRAPRIYTGRHIGKLIGKYKMGKTDPDSILADQVHGC